jgi:hypothetical protein
MPRPLTLADFAAVERDGREKFYPGMVQRGELTAAEAQHDWLCWRAIADFYLEPPCDHPGFLEWGLTWRNLADAAAKALERREEALAKARPDQAPPLEARRDAVACIAWRLGRRAQFFESLTHQLRAEARQRTAKEAA